MILCIYAVDGETTFSIDSTSKAAILEFLHHHDHEGSSLSLDTGEEELEDNEKVYEFLRET